MSQIDNGDFEDRDDYAVQKLVSKAEERQMLMHESFEAVCAKFWQLITTSGSSQQDRSRQTLYKGQHYELISRIYRVLVPLYREGEMTKEIAQDWILDAAGCDEMGLGLFQKMLFRLANQWATNIDLAEYVDLLERVYNRITHRRVVRASGKVEYALPSIRVQISQSPGGEGDEEGGYLGADDEGNGRYDEPWESAASQEEEEEGYKYEVREGKRFKKRLQDDEEPDSGLKQPGSGSDVDDEDHFFTTRDPFHFTEEVEYYHSAVDCRGKRATNPPEPDDFEYDVLTNVENVFPLGYPTEQYFCWIKNDVYKAFQKLKEEKKQALANMKRELFEGSPNGGPPPQIGAAGDADPGLVPVEKQTLEQAFRLHSSNFDVCIGAYAIIKDAHYNSLRTLLKDNNKLVVRPENLFPARKRGLIDDEPVDLGAPLVRKSVFGYNPVIERRLNYRMTQIEDKKGGKQSMWVNVNYLIVDPVFETAYRSDVHRVETGQKMAIKPSDEFQREEDFCNVTTSYAEAKQIMLQKKFETLFTVKLQGDEERAVERDTRVFELELHRQKHARMDQHLVNKQLEETFDSTDFLKVTNGPFYKLLSHQGPSHDNFYSMATHDLIDAATSKNLRILLIGAPRSGKTTLARLLVQHLNIVRVSADTWIERLFAKIKDREENPPEEEEPEPVAEEVEGEEGVQEKPKKSWLEPLEEAVLKTLQQGLAPSSEQIDQMLCELVASPAARTRGFVLDLDFTEENFEAKLSWRRRIEAADVLGGQRLTHVVELLIEEAEVRQRAKNMLSSVSDGLVYSQWERNERNKPKVILEDEEEPEEDENAPPPLVESEMVMRPCDLPEVVTAQSHNYKNGERPDFDSMVIKLSHTNFVQVAVDGLQPEEIALAVTSRIRAEDSQPLTPVATIIEGGGDLKGLLTEGIETDEGTLPRQWSLWKSVDPVSLSEGTVAPGIPDYACSYANNVFVFQTEENMKSFVANPRNFLQAAPQMPSDYRVMVVGPRGAGANTQARLLEELYGWRIVDFSAIIKSKIAEILASPQKLPNNVSEDGPCSITCSDQELQEIKDGKFIPSWKFLPWVLEYLEIPLMRKPPPPPEEVQEPDLDSMTDDERKAYEKEQKKKADEKKKREKEEEEKAKAKEERAKQRAAALEEGKDLAELGLEETEEEIIIDDLPLDQLVPKVDEFGKMPKIGSFILLGFPHTELQVTKMKEYGLGLDRVVFLNDMSEEDPGRDLKLRFHAKHGKDVTFDWERESEAVQKVVAVLKEFVSDEIVREINCAGPTESVFIRLRTDLDPFFLLPDNPEDNRTTEAEVTVDDDEYAATKWLPKSDFGHYCPVTYVKHKWLCKGNREFESTIHGKTYWFAGEPEQTEFKFNPTAYLQDLQLPLAPPPPKIMLVGMKGAGVTTQIKKLCDKFKIESLEVMPALLQHLDEEKKKRERGRLLARGFKPLPEVEEGEEEPVDPEIVEDPEEFDRVAHERDVLQEVLDSSKSLVIDGHWTSLPEEAVAQPLHELLIEGRRAPEIVIMLRCKEETTEKRCIDTEAIQKQHEKLTKERKEKADKLREEDQIAKKAELEEENKQDPEDENKKSEEEVAKLVEESLDEWLKERIEADEQADEDDPDRPVYADMLDAEKEKLKEMRDKDEGFLQELGDALKERQVEVIDAIQSDMSADFVHIKILAQLKKRMQYRNDLIERELCSQLPLAEVKHYEASYTYKHSKFGLASPLNPFNPCKTKQQTVLYRERLYFPATAEERDQFMTQPSKYTLKVEPAPQDLTLRPTAVVIGLAKSGRSALAKTIAKRTGMVHLDIAEIIEAFVDRDCHSSQDLAKKVRVQGKEIDDITMVELLARRITFKDCVQRGWVLDGFPQTRQQSIHMVKRGISPLNIFHLQVPVEEVYKRSVDYHTSDFSCDRTILARRLSHQVKELPQVAYFWQKYYGSLSVIDGMKSKWYIETLTLEAIEQCMRARLLFARDYCSKPDKQSERACIMENMHFDRKLVKQSISQYGYFCPVTWRKSNKFVNCVHRPKFCVLYHNFFYYFAGAEERASFLTNPHIFTKNVIFSQARNRPQYMRHHKAAEIIAQEKALLGHCPVTLKDEDRIEKGQQLITVTFKDVRFIFASTEKAAKFYLNPSRYASVTLPVKMPPAIDPVNLYSLQKQEDSITFMEQALGQVVTRGLREVGENRLKYPTLSVKETMLKLFAIFLKAENPANTEYMQGKYRRKMQEFIYRCEVPVELFELTADRAKKQKKWPDFKEDYYNKLGDKFDSIMKEVTKERLTGFAAYIK